MPLFLLCDHREERCLCSVLWLSSRLLPAMSDMTGRPVRRRGEGGMIWRLLLLLRSGLEQLVHVKAGLILWSSAGFGKQKDRGKVG